MSWASMLKEKRDGVDAFSMTRVTVAFFALIGGFYFFMMAVLGVAIGYPFAWIVFAILFAIPFKDLFSGVGGGALLGKFLDRFGTGGIGTNASADSIKAISDAVLKRRDADEGIEETR